MLFKNTKGSDIKNEPLKIISFVIDLKVSMGPDLKYSRDKTKIEIINSVNKENFWRVPFLKKQNE